MIENKFINILNRLIFFIYVFLSIYETYISEIFGNITSVYLIIFCVFLLLNTRRRTLSVNQLLMLLWISLYYVSLLWTPNMQQAALYIGTVSAMSCAAILCENCYFSRSLITDVISMYKWCSVSMAILGVFFSEPMGIDNTARSVLTIGGIQPDPNNLVALYSIGSGLSLLGLKKGSSHKIANFIGFLACVYCILIAGSRSGILIIGIQVLIWSFYANRKASFLVKSLSLVTIFGVIGYVMLSYINIEAIERMFGLGELSFTDSTGRESLWESAIEKFYSSPIIGNGWGACPSHNTFFTILVDVGIIGLGLLIIYLIRLFIRILKLGDASAVVIFISCLIQSFFIDAQNKRFFWNIILLSILIINSYVPTISDSKNNTDD